MGFDAGEAVTSLDWDFTKFNAGKGTTAEPSTQAVELFHKKYVAFARAVNNEFGTPHPEREEDSPEPMSFKAALEAISSIDISSLTEETDGIFLEMVAEVCGGSPSLEQLRKLPIRVQTAFCGWIVAQLLDPNVYASGSMRSLRLVRSA